MSRSTTKVKRRRGDRLLEGQAAIAEHLGVTRQTARGRLHEPSNPLSAVVEVAVNGRWSAWAKDLDAWLSRERARRSR